jgi:hypothetical protein
MSGQFPDRHESKVPFDNSACLEGGGSLTPVRSKLVFSVEGAPENDAPLAV